MEDHCAMIPIPICLICKYYQDDQSCKAFDKIPDAIWLGMTSHRIPYPGDGGITFEAKKVKDNTNEQPKG